VYRIKERGRSFGKTMIIDILRGSKNEKIRRFGLEGLSVWGIMGEEKPHRIRTFIDFLIDEGCLVTEGDEYPVVALGEGYEEILREERRLCLKMPREQKPQPKQQPRQQPGLQAVPKETTSVRSEPVLKIQNDDNTIIDNVIFEKLKELRREFAAKEGVPAYIVFSDANLRDMCRKIPVSLDQFSAVNGVGKIKLEKYGQAFVELIKNLSLNTNI
jgi:ATP-dependent DNA helicase RecQ